ncbi:MAG TPA: DUF4199 domain-containing protein [Bacteroidales bacterium]|jgi:hypothetical protein|nr:DUF4199 domain-containing protein [Bacteroidales bacterium]
MESKEENKSYLLEYTMHAGILLGLFWIFKYLFVILGNKYPGMNVIGTTLSIGTPVLLYYLLVKYNAGWMNREMRFGQGVQFTILLFFFASILEALVVYIHIRWIDPAYLAHLYDSMIELAEALGASKAIVTRLAEQPLPNAFTYIFNNVIMADVFIGLLLSLLIVPLALRFTPRQNNPQ